MPVCVQMYVCVSFSCVCVSYTFTHVHTPDCCAWAAQTRSYRSCAWIQFHRRQKIILYCLRANAVSLSLSLSFFSSYSRSDQSMSDISGQTLESFARANDLQPAVRACTRLSWIVDLFEGITYMHEFVYSFFMSCFCLLRFSRSVRSHGIIHRDIKPENVLIDKCARARIADMGIAVFLPTDKVSSMCTYITYCMNVCALTLLCFVKDRHSLMCCVQYCPSD